MALADKFKAKFPTRCNGVDEKFFFRQNFRSYISPFFRLKFSFYNLHFAHVAQKIDIVNGDVAAAKTAESGTVRFDDAAV